MLHQPILLALSFALAALLGFAAHRAQVPRTEVVEGLWRIAGVGSIELDVALSEDLPATLATDRLQLERLLGHLLSHAASAGGAVGARLAAAGDAVEIKVGHGGTPIPEDQRAAAFEPFQPGLRGASALDLPIAGALAELLGGDLELRSEGGADVFALVLPVGPL